MNELQKDQKVKLRIDVSSIRSHEILCKIKRVENDRIILIYPEDKMVLAKYLFEGKDLEVVAYTHKGIFVFESIVIDSPFEVEFTVELPEEKTKIQRREYIRAPFKGNLTLFKQGQTIEAETINIGGGGIRFKVNRELPVSDIWNFILPLPKWSSAPNGIGEILYTIKQDNYFISVIKFIEIEENDRNKIIKMCFDEEVARLKIKAEELKF